MPLQSSGPITLGDINVEFQRARTAPVGLMSLYRGGAIVGSAAPGVPTSGPLSMFMFYGVQRAWFFAETISANITNYNLRTRALAAGWDGILPLVAVVTINSGVWVSASSAAVYAFDTGTGIPAGSDLHLINYGTIVGVGGAGGSASGVGTATAGNVIAGSAGSPGGPALIARVPLRISNYGAIGGGGGGGGGGRGTYDRFYSAGDGKTGGAGWTGTIYPAGGGGGGRSSLAANSPGGSFSPWGAGYGASYNAAAGGQPRAGGVGTYAAAGPGGSGGSFNSSQYASGGGSGGTWGQSGGGGDGGTVALSTSAGGPYAGGSAGAAVHGNNNITWEVIGTRYGAIVA